MAKLTGVKTIDMKDGEITKISYEGAEYAKVDGEAKKGDIIRATEDISDTSAGSFYEIYETYFGRNSFYDDVEDSCDVGRTPSVTYRKISESTSPTLEEVSEKLGEVEKRVTALEGAEETLKVGDRVRIAGKSIFGANHDGEIGTLNGIDEDGDYEVRIAGGYRRYFERDQLTIVGCPQARRPKEGDIVVITANTNGSDNNVGDIGKVGEMETDVARVQVPGGVEYVNWTDYNDMRLATPAEIKRYEDAVEAMNAPKLAVGDYVRTLAESKYGVVAEGTNAKVVEVYGDGNFVVMPLGDEDAKGIYRSQDLELIEGKALAFAKAGRKLNEYKKGDIVRYIGGASVKGRIFVVESDTEGGRTRVDFGRGAHGICFEYNEDLEPVAFVESRVDVK